MEAKKFQVEWNKQHKQRLMQQKQDKYAHQITQRVKENNTLKILKLDKSMYLVSLSNQE